MAERFYPIKDLSDVLSKFRMELNLATEEINKRIDELEQRMSQGVTTGYVPADIMKTKYHEYDYPVEEEAVTGKGVRPMSLIAEIAAARRALYGYGMLLRELGLSKEHSQAVRQLEQMISMVLRLYQTMVLLQAIQAGTIFGPLGIILAGGTLAGSLMFGAKSIGG